MKLRDLKKQIFDTCKNFDFIDSIHLIDETEFSIKFRLHINELMFVQIYQNIASGTTSYVLVRQTNRLFGRDCVGGCLHCHPFENPIIHDFSEQGSKACTLEEFLEEVENLLINAGLI